MRTIILLFSFILLPVLSPVFSLELQKATAQDSEKSATQAPQKRVNYGIDFPEYEKPSDIPLNVFARDADFNRVVLSPDGSKFVQVVPYNDDYRITVRSFDAEDNRRYSDFLVRADIFGRVLWANNRRLLIQTNTYLIDRNRNIFAVRTLYGVDVTRSKLEEIFSAKYKYSKTYTRDTILSMKRDDDDTIVVTFNKNGKGWPGVHTLDVYTGETEMLEEGQKNIDDWYVDMDGNVRYGQGWINNKLYVISRRDAKSAWTQVNVANLGETDEYEFISYDKTNPAKALVATTLKSENTNALFEFDLKTGTLGQKIFQDEKLDFLGIETTGATKLAYVVQDHLLKRTYLDKKHETMIRSIQNKLKGMDVYLYSTSEDGRYAMLYVTNEKFPGGYYRYDRETRNLASFGPINPELDPNLMAAKEVVEISTDDGFSVQSYLTRPLNYQDGEKLPLFVMPHGGPWARDDKSYDFWEQFLVSRGYAVLKVNFRGSEGFGRKFIRAADGQWGGKVIDDIKQSVDYFINDGTVDADRICIGGISFGGYAALMSAIRYPEFYKCTLSVNGFTSTKWWYNDLRKNGGKDYAKRIIGSNKAAVFKDHDVLLRYKDLKIPVLLIHGEDDKNVDISQSEKLHKKLKKTSTPVKYYPLENEGHHLRMARSRNLLLKQTERFLKEHIGEGRTDD